MKRKMMKKTAAAVLSLLLGSCTKEIPASEDTVHVKEGRELFCLSETSDEAEETASLYGIELVDFSDGVAVFHYEGDAAALIETGKQNGWKQLSLNTDDTTVR